MQPLEINRLDLPELLQSASALDTSGCIVVTSNNLACLKVDDAYIHQLFPLLNIPGINKPNYFKDNGIGAHVSIIYPEEGVIIAESDIGTKHTFSVTSIFTAIIHQKRYYALKITAPSLTKLRQRYGLGEDLNFKNYWIGFHITIATASLKSGNI